MPAADFTGLAQGQHLTPEQVNYAFREKYGIDAPSFIVNNFAGHVGGQDTGFYDRVLRGDFENDIRGNTPGFFEQATFARAKKMQEEAIAPAVATARQSIPITEQAYGQRETSIKGQVEPLKQRYQNILADLTNREKTESDRSTLALAREYGKRGVPLSSGVYDQTLTNDVLNPITSKYGVQRKDVGLAQEGDLRQISDLLASLPIEKSREINLINQAIAQMQAGAGTNAIAQAIQAMQQQSDNTFRQKQLDLQSRGLDLEEKYKAQPAQQDAYATLSEGQTLYNLLTGQPLYTAPKTYKPTGSGGGSGFGSTGLEGLFNQFSGNGRYSLI